MKSKSKKKKSAKARAPKPPPEVKKCILETRQLNEKVRSGFWTLKVFEPDWREIGELLEIDLESEGIITRYTDQPSYLSDQYGFKLDGDRAIAHEPEYKTAANKPDKERSQPVNNNADMILKMEETDQYLACNMYVKGREELHQRVATLFRIGMESGRLSGGEVVGEKTFGLRTCAGKTLFHVD